MQYRLLSRIENAGCIAQTCIMYRCAINTRQNADMLKQIYDSRFLKTWRLKKPKFIERMPAMPARTSTVGSSRSAALGLELGSCLRSARHAHVRTAGHANIPRYYRQIDKTARKAAVHTDKYIGRQTERQTYNRQMEDRFTEIDRRTDARDGQTDRYR